MSRIGLIRPSPPPSQWAAQMLVELLGGRDHHGTHLEQLPFEVLDVPGLLHVARGRVADALMTHACAVQALV